MGFFGVKKRYPYPSGQRSFGAEAIIDYTNSFIETALIWYPTLQTGYRFGAHGLL
jgi:hypothetical protein